MRHFVLEFSCLNRHELEKRQPCLSVGGSSTSDSKSFGCRIKALITY